MYKTSVIMYKNMENLIYSLHLQLQTDLTPWNTKKTDLPT